MCSCLLYFLEAIWPKRRVIICVLALNIHTSNPDFAERTVLSFNPHHLTVLNFIIILERRPNLSGHSILACLMVPFVNFSETSSSRHALFHRSKLETLRAHEECIENIFCALEKLYVRGFSTLWNVDQDWNAFSQCYTGDYFEMIDVCSEKNEVQTVSACLPYMRPRENLSKITKAYTL